MALEQAVAYYTLDVSITTSAAKTKPQIGIERMSGSRTVRVFGSIPAGAHADVENLAIADPAEYAAMVFKQALEARGISVSGVAVAEHNQIPKTMAVLDESRQPLGKFPAEPSIYGLGWSSNYGCSDCGKDRVPMTETTVASVSSPPILEDIVLTNKVSQNLHAELLLRQLGMFAGTDGSFGEGARVVRQFLVRAGVNPNDFVFYDGSGLSRKDMVTPRAVTTLLRYAAGQPWFADWKSSLPIGGVDGSLKSRFPSAPLKGNLQDRVIRRRPRAERICGLRQRQDGGLFHFCERPHARQQ